MRASDYAQRVPFREYMEQTNAETLVAVHIETEDSLDRLPEVLGVEGLDVAFLGPTDLSNSLGFPGELQNPKVQATFQRFVDAVVCSSVTLGLMVPNAEAARQWRARTTLP